MTISLITANPDTSNPADFAVQADLAWQQLIVAIPEINTAIEAFNFNATNSTSTTSLLISVASKSLTVQTGKSYQPGMAVTIAYTTDPTQWMRGEVISYDSGTGALVVNVRYISDTVGTYAVWTISQAAIEASIADSKLLITTPGGHGSINTKIRLMTIISINTGTAFTVVNSATLGTTITINEPGIYTFSASDSYSSASAIFGLTVNATDLTDSVRTNGNISKLMGGIHCANSTAGNKLWLSVTDRLNSGDVVRLHDNGLNNDTSTDGMIFARKIGNV